ncbi:MAG: hypothetical protein Q8M02_14315 [Candidatus Didemnitutus sp.]|nr:hypothetical protein [Candidatus Didemnitutus sp.]
MSPSAPPARYWLSPLLLGGVVLLCLGAWFWLRPSPDAPTSPTGLPPGVEAKLTPAGEKLRDAIHAQLQRRYAEADALFLEAQTGDPLLRGIDYQRAVGQFNLHNFAAARALARTSIDKGEEVAASHILLGTMHGVANDHAAALLEFMQASEAQPENPLPRYNMSESLRHLGRAADAIIALRGAMQANPGEVLYAFKFRLARIEAGQEKELEADIHAQLAARPPAGDWILTAAAISLRHERFAEAAGLMSAARQVMQPGLFFALIQDRLFSAHRLRPEIAPFYDVQITQPGDAAPSKP